MRTNAIREIYGDHLKLIDPFRPHKVSVGICTFTVSIEAVDHVTNQQVLGLLLNMERKQRLKCGKGTLNGE